MQGNMRLDAAIGKGVVGDGRTFAGNSAEKHAEYMRAVRSGIRNEDRFYRIRDAFVWSTLAIGNLDRGRDSGRITEDE